MMTPANNAVFDVARECYVRADVAVPGSEAAEVAEHAITLTLGRDESSPWLLDDVLTNARFSVRRSRQRQLRLVGDASAHAVLNQPTGASRGMVDIESPETLTLARELRDLLAARAAELGAGASRVLAGLYVGETAPETATAAGVSESTVRRVQHQLRASVIEAGYRVAVAA